ncbi:hypothetical protein BBBOND_0306930 [Babesia bigemina]|uniref:6-Cys domain-containing protein n=1 Tax=Babesia bigemina TaxID=5866 RepID=A0A061DCN5_BABBI|nr:hypothetical protein BBBOND_0306930 [Babesia bigemina]CDR96789.1 hypothetical protein BBBOND_0306930 [Babesia bigemina]|eukprot:XP_012768975.1 hypothetical protein BBBOND_0306930 [Babesia bigemina]
MAKVSSQRSIWAFCGIWLCSIVRLVASNCDFARPRDILASNALVACHKNLEFTYSASANCPRRVNNIEYVWHPQPSSDENGQINTYVGESDELRTVPLSTVLRTEDQHEFITVESKFLVTDIKFTKPYTRTFAITQRRLIFICGPKYLELNDELQRYLHRLDNFGPNQVLPWNVGSPMIQEISKIGGGLGVFYLVRGRMDRPYQGCGSRPSPLFDAENEVSIDPDTGTVSCVADPMSLSPIGFVCEGLIEPADCMMSLINKSDEVATVTTPHLYNDFEKNGKWVVARYFNGLALPPIDGECRCVDSETGRVKAKIEIRSKTEYVCDISKEIFSKPFSHVSGPWCSVVLHPGSTLTIRLPTEQINTAPTVRASEDDVNTNFDMEVDEDASAVALSPLPSVYDYETEFLPSELYTLRHLASVFGFVIHDESMHHEAIAGDALEFDVSQMERGEVKIRYHLDKPMALRHASNAFYYHWTLISKDKNVRDKVRGTIALHMAFTHEYNIIGCDRRPQSVFNPKISQKHCSVKSMGNGIGDVYECAAPIKEDFKQTAGIYCRSDEELLPPTCQSLGYDLRKNRIVSIPASLRHATPYPIRGFQLFDYFYRSNNPVSYACSCVDQRGYEKSRLIVTSHQHENVTSIIYGDYANPTLLPRILLPWDEVELSSEGRTPPAPLVLKHVSQESFELDLGKTLSITCGIAAAWFSHGNTTYDAPHVRIDEDLAATWLPKHPEEFYYSVNETNDVIELVKATYGSSIVTTPGGFQVGYHSDENGTEPSKLVLRSTMGAILISKNATYKQFVPMTFVCSKRPEPSDLSVITDNASTSDAPEQPIANALESATGATWNIVEVKVEMTDPYMQGCGVTYSSTELFKPETPKLYDADGQEIGCQIDINTAHKAAFYCPAPYVMDPPNCFTQVYVGAERKNLKDISESLMAYRSSHFVILRFERLRIRSKETLRQTPPLECRCVTAKGVVLSTIQIENYYAE